MLSAEKSDHWPGSWSLGTSERQRGSLAMRSGCKPELCRKWRGVDLWQMPTAKYVGAQLAFLHLFQRLDSNCVFLFSVQVISWVFYCYKALLWSRAGQQGFLDESCKASLAIHCSTCTGSIHWWDSGTHLWQLQNGHGKYITLVHFRTWKNRLRVWQKSVSFPPTCTNTRNRLFLSWEHPSFVLICTETSVFHNVFWLLRRGKCCFWSPVKLYYSSCLSSCLVLCAQSYFSGYMTNITLWSWVSAYISPMETALSFLIALADTSINVSASAFFSLDLQKARAMHYAELFMD